MSYFLTTVRLGFRHWTNDDEPLAALLWKDPGVMRHMGGPYDDDGVRSRLALEISQQQSIGLQYWPIFLLETGEFAGCAGLRPFHDEDGVAEIGIHIARKFWSARLGEEAAEILIEHAFYTLKLDALVAGHGPGNLPSKALIERMGFIFTHEEPWGKANVMHPFYRRRRTP
jgi:ribosomal-protein-alanine N-acetyltransferase